MTQYRSGYLPNGSWTVEQSDDGLRPVVIVTLPTARAARAFIDARTGVLRPAREAADGSSLPSAASRAGRGSGLAVPLGQDGSPTET